MGETLGYRQVGKTADFDSAIRWSESGYPNEKNKHLQKKNDLKWVDKPKENSKLLFVNEIGSWNQFDDWKFGIKQNKLKTMELTKGIFHSNEWIKLNERIRCYVMFHLSDLFEPRKKTR